jgi:hypothetical protein
VLRLAFGGLRKSKRRERFRRSERRRAQGANALKAFEQSLLDPLEKTIEANAFEKFDTAFKAGVQSCNGCHAALGLPFYELLAGVAMRADEVLARAAIHLPAPALTAAWTLHIRVPIAQS